jgi:signal transduction histidine kinase/HD-like signal output (HDOD) protein
MKLPRSEQLLVTVDAERLPAQPEVVRAALRESAREGATAHRWLFRDPALAAHVLMATGQPARTVVGGGFSLERIAAALGDEVLKSIAVSAAERMASDLLRGVRQWNTTGFWLHCLTSAEVGRSVAELVRYPDVDEAYLVGLMQDVGMLALAMRQPGLYEPFGASIPREEELLADESSVMGLAHPSVSAALADRWGLPPHIGDALLLHQAPPEDLQGTHMLVRIARAAEALSDGPANVTRLEAIAALLEVRPAMLLEAASRGVKRAQAIAAEAGLAGEDLQRHFPNGLPQFRPPQPAPPASGDGGLAASLDQGDAATRELVAELIDHASVQRLALALSETTDLKSCLVRLRQILSATLGQESFIVFLYEDQRETLVGWHVVKDGLEATGFRLPVTLASSVVTTAANDRTTVSSVASTEGHRLVGVDVQVARRLRADALFALPLVSRDACVGVLVLGAVGDGRGRPAELRPGESSRAAQPVGELERLRDLSPTIASRILGEVAREREAQAREQTLRLQLQRSTRRLVHEARNPLTVVRNYLELLRQRSNAGEAVDLEIDILKQEIDRINHLLGAIARFDEMPNDSRDYVDINQLIPALLLVYQQPLFDKRSIEVVLGLDQALPPVQTDPDVIRQVLLNLLKNASEAMPGGGAVEISTVDGAALRGRPAIEITIADTGPGLAPGVVERLARGEPVNAGSGDRGYGLSNSIRYVKSVGGQMTWRTQAGKGTTFHILLPRVTAGDAAEPLPDAP